MEFPFGTDFHGGDSATWSQTDGWMNLGFLEQLLSRSKPTEALTVEESPKKGFEQLEGRRTSPKHHLKLQKLEQRAPCSYQAWKEEELDLSGHWPWQKLAKLNVTLYMRTKRNQILTNRSGE